MMHQKGGHGHHNQDTKNMLHQFRQLFIQPWQNYYLNVLQHETDSVQAKQAYFKTMDNVNKTLLLLVEMAQQQQQPSTIVGSGVGGNGGNASQLSSSLSSSSSVSPPFSNGSGGGGGSGTANGGGVNLMMPTFNMGVTSPVLSPGTPSSLLFSSRSSNSGGGVTTGSSSVLNGSGAVSHASAVGSISSSSSGSISSSSVNHCQLTQLAQQMNMLNANLYSVRVARLEKEVQDLRNQLQVERSEKMKANNACHNKPVN